jgi:GTP-binding protein
MVFGRGVLHYLFLLKQWEENELQITTKVKKEIDGKKCEPIEELTIDLPENLSGRAVEFVTTVKERCWAWKVRERMVIKFNIPSRGIIGLRNQLTATAGEAIMSHRFIGYEPLKEQFWKKQWFIDLNGKWKSNSLFYR